MGDPDEGVGPDGTIRTGAHRARVPAAFEPVLRDAVRHVGPGVPLYVYGSVANGTARPGRSDVDLLAIDLPGSSDAGARLSERYADLCRGVEISVYAASGL
ncbi:MAG: nucleotidyltransferase domain-containing protein, partial [Nocardioides sp.]|nr:nucleotidyltransferase domain-containing protein [Nocardioides sp.]